MVRGAKVGRGRGRGGGASRGEERSRAAGVLIPKATTYQNACHVSGADQALVLFAQPAEGWGSAVVASVSDSGRDLPRAAWSR